jgi:HK97 family phage major capsid protein
MLDTETRELLNEVKSQLAQSNKIAAAVEQLEEQLRVLPKTIESKIAAIRSVSWDDRGNYRGVFASEDQARAFGLLIMARTNGDFANRAADALKSEFKDVHQRAMDSTADGALIPTEFSTRLQSLFESYGVFEANAFRMPMSSDQEVFMRQTGDPDVFLLSENTDADESEPSFDAITLNAKEWGTYMLYPKTLGEDAAAAVGELIAVSFVRAIAKKADNIGFNGDGTATYFGISGVRQRLVNVNGVDDGGGLVLGSGNLWSELVLADFNQVVGALPQYAADEAAWYCSRMFFYQVMIPAAITEGTATLAELQGRAQMMFLGYPVRFTQVMPVAQANSQVPVVLGNLRQAATVGDRRMVKIDQSEHAAFRKRQVAVLGSRRIAINVHDVGTATEAGPVVGLITASS